MPSPALITDVRSLDNLDDRREVHGLLAKLSPRRRYNFLAWACEQCWLPNSNVHPSPSWFRMGERVRAATRGDDEQDLALTNEIYTDLWHLTMQYELSARVIAAALEACVRRGTLAVLGDSRPASLRRQRGPRVACAPQPVQPHAMPPVRPALPLRA